MHEVGDDSFEEQVINSSLPILVDFWASWCGPCKLIQPVIERLAEEFRDKVRFCKLDVDANRLTAERYQVRGIPYLILFNNGKPVDTRVGALSKSQLTKFIESAL